MIYVVGTGLLAETIATALDEWGHPAFIYNNRSGLISEGSTVWFAEDMPVDDLGNSSSSDLLSKMYHCLDLCTSRTLFIISSQVQIGTARLTQERWPDINIVSVPENSRRGFMLDNFLDPDRIVIGTQFGEQNRCIDKLYPVHLRHRIHWVNYETAEMTKHALNSFLALSITFANEMDRICQAHNASYQQVMNTLLDDARIGHNAYLRSGKADGRHLLRDVRYLIDAVDDPVLLPDILRSPAWDN